MISKVIEKFYSVGVEIKCLRGKIRLDYKKKVQRKTKNSVKQVLKCFRVKMRLDHKRKV